MICLTMYLFSFFIKTRVCYNEAIISNFIRNKTIILHIWHKISEDLVSKGAKYRRLAIFVDENNRVLLETLK